jgi:Mg2+ and Co2+ transporter CorA
MSAANDNAGGRPQPDIPDTIGGILALALNMEDQISNGVYEDYMRRESWPQPLDEEVLADIRQRLTTLVEDTKKHRQTLEALVGHYGTES